MRYFFHQREGPQKGSTKLVKWQKAGFTGISPSLAGGYSFTNT
jgi:hypothetical protein